MLRVFSERADTKLNLKMPNSGIEFVVVYVWGTGVREDDLLGLICQHKNTDSLCQCRLNGVDPNMVGTRAPVMIAQASSHGAKFAIMQSWT